MIKLFFQERYSLYSIGKFILYETRRCELKINMDTMYIKINYTGFANEDEKEK